MERYSIETENLTKKFGNFVSVNNLSFKVKEGEIFGFLGSNGAGKSTTIRMLCSIISPTSGKAYVAGFDIEKNPNEVKKNIGYMSQKFSLYDDLSIEENINFFAGIYGVSSKLLKSRKDWILQISNLKTKEKILTKTLPGGIKQRLAIGVAVVHKPKIIFLDEPTSGVDPIERRNFWELINCLSQEGISVFVSTHYLEEAEFCNNIILLDSGEIIAQGSPSQLKNNYLNFPMYEFEVKETNFVLKKLKDAYFTQIVYLFGSKIHLILNEQKLNEKIIFDYLKDEQITNLNKISPSLEDIFVFLINQKNV